MDGSRVPDEDFRELAREVAKHEDHAILVEIDAMGKSWQGSQTGLAHMPEEPTAPARYAHLADRIADLVGHALREKGPHGPPQVIAGLRLPAETPPVQAWRALAATLESRGLDVPIVLAAAVRPRQGSLAASALEDVLLQAAQRLGSLLIDGIGDAVRIDALPDPRRAVDLAYGILQGARARTTKTEYISCPSCGRTLFDLETTTAKIKGKTDHLKGVKIAVMGCIVNGPGEMADADFGYVGWKPGKVNLYVGKEVVVRDVEEDEAADRLVQLIRDHGRWNEPVQAPFPPSMNPPSP
ncbi:flavodoxin-dependent (E)-4-hydroxy-3-methylbut-2-enyl-diphosphate synthase [bacterium]|nr:flavodoxin-dependent (E)-4-hydroxy-3-methylbut-2-enyl-diphosphate synthase [bacterium]